MADPAHVFFRVDEEDIVANSDIVIVLIADDGDLRARLATPEWGWATLMEPRTAFISAFEHLNGTTYEAEVVIVDAQNLWKSHWGDLLDHPSRPPRERRQLSA